MPRFLKQTVLALIFFTAVGSAVYFFSVKDAPLPAVSSPAASVSPLLVPSQKLLKVRDRDYDFLVEIKNPNFDFGAAEVFYELSLFEGGTLNVPNGPAERDAGKPATITGSISLLPGQSRFEIVSPIRTEAEISRAEFKIISVTWERLKEFIPQNLFSLKNQGYSLLPQSQGFSRLSGTLFNSSNFDFDRVDVFVVLYGSDGDILAGNKTDIRTMLAKTERFFEVKWPVSFKGEVSRIEVSAHTDIFKNSNFLKEHGTEERFQNFY